MSDQDSNENTDTFNKEDLLNKVKMLNKQSNSFHQNGYRQKVTTHKKTVTNARAIHKETDNFLNEDQCFSSLPAYKQLKTQKAFSNLINLENPYFRLHESIASAATKINGKTYDNFTSYDYLGLNGHERLNKAAKSAIDQYGTSVSASRPTAGDRPLMRDLEQKIAQNYKTEGALVFLSGHSTNMSTIPAIISEEDLIIMDSFSHNSLTQGAKVNHSARLNFTHNDLDHLEELVATHRNSHPRLLIISEGLFSMDGDIPDLNRLIEIKKKYNCWLMIDDAHALGVLGKTGKGSFEHCNVNPADIDIWMGTLSKTLCGAGGYIAGSQALIDLLKFEAAGFMYSVGISPPVAAAAQEALTLMQEKPDLVKKLQSNSQLFLNEAIKAGLDVGEAKGYGIVPVIVGDSLMTTKLSERLMRKGLCTTPVTYPAISMKQARLRFFILANHTEEQIKNCVATVKEELNKLESENYNLKTVTDQLNL